MPLMTFPSCFPQGWAKPTRIQKEAIPQLLNGRDVIGLAQTGSGKTGGSETAGGSRLDFWYIVRASLDGSSGLPVERVHPAQYAEFMFSLTAGAFALPILQSLLDKPQALYALVLSPTRELAIQIAEQFEALGVGIGLKTAGQFASSILGQFCYLGLQLCSWLGTSSALNCGHCSFATATSCQ